MSTRIFKYSKPFNLELGGVLPELEIAYHAYGVLNKNKDNAIWVCHALTASSDAESWWTGLIGNDFTFDPNKHFIICANILGSCYGTTGPLTINPNTGEPYYHYFPVPTIRDLVAAHELLRQHLEIKKINTIIGGSMGGQQAMEWAITSPGLFENLILVATNAKHSPWGIAFNETQRLAIESDATFKQRLPAAGHNGLKVARSIALLSYRHYSAYKKSQSETDENKTDQFKAASYQQYQGEKLVKRFNAFSYYTLSKTMDTHNIARGRGSAEEVLAAITANTLVISINSDILFPKQEQAFLALHIHSAAYAGIDSDYGHDGFLTESEKLGLIISNFLVKKEKFVTNER